MFSVSLKETHTHIHTHTHNGIQTKPRWGVPSKVWG
jgi:hypothetical protein